MPELSSAGLQEAQAFLEGVFPDPLQGHLLLWALSNKQSQWFDNRDELARACVGRPNVYIGVGTSPQAMGAGNRCSADKIQGIGALWLDIDIQHSGIHESKPLPKTLEEALSLACSISKPSYCIHSGYGIQAWWCFNEFWNFTTSKERREASNLIWEWQGAHRLLAFQQGWEIDSVADLSRVMRVPGSLNAKREPHKPVKILQEYSTRLGWEPSDLAALAEPYNVSANLPRDSSTGSTQPRGALTLDPNAQVPWGLWGPLKEADQRVGQTWEKARSDLKDTSPSGWDLSLASFCVQAGWENQEIADLLINRRKKHGDDLKLNRVDYYQRTISKARSGHHQEQAQARLESIVEIGGAEDNQENKSVILTSLSATFSSGENRLRFDKVIKYMTDPPKYRLETSLGSISIGGVSGLIVQNQFRNNLAAATGILVPGKKPQAWHTIAQSLLHACEEIDAGEEGTEQGAVKGWLRGYLSDSPPLSPGEHPEEREMVIKSKKPFIKDGGYHIFLADFRHWLKVALSEMISTRDLAVLLRSSGAKTVNVRLGEVVIYTWRVSYL